MGWQINHRVFGTYFYQEIFGICLRVTFNSVLCIFICSIWQLCSHPTLKYFEINYRKYNLYLLLEKGILKLLFPCFVTISQPDRYSSQAGLSRCTDKLPVLKIHGNEEGFLVSLRPFTHHPSAGRSEFSKTQKQRSLESLFCVGVKWYGPRMQKRVLYSYM